MAGDLGAAAYSHLTSHPRFAEALASGWVGKDPEEEGGSLWVFQGLNDDGRPYRDPEGTGTGVIVLTAGRTEWASNPHNTNRFPVLQVLYYMDSTRNADGSPALRDAESKCRDLAYILDPVFHIFETTNVAHVWTYLDELDATRRVGVHYSRRSSGLDIRDVPGTQSLTVRGEQRYELSTD